MSRARMAGSENIGKASTRFLEPGITEPCRRCAKSAADQLPVPVGTVPPQQDATRIFDNVAKWVKCIHESEALGDGAQWIEDRRKEHQGRHEERHKLADVSDVHT